MKNQPSPLTPKKRTRLSPVPTGSVKKARYVKKSSNSDTGSPTVSSDDGSGSVEQHRRLKRPAPLTPRKSLETLNQFSKLHIATPSSSRFVQHSPGIQASYTALEIDEHLGMEQDSEADDAEEQEVSNTVLDAFPESDAEVRSDTEPVRDVRQVIKEYIYPPPLRRFKLGMIDGEEYGPEQSWMEGETVNEEDHGSDKPVRILDQFIFYLDSCMQLCALGEVSPKIDEDELGDIGSEVDDVQEPSLIYLGPVVDAYQGGSAASTSIWVETDLAWYILGVSHPLYRETYKPFFIAHTFTLIFSHLANDKPMASPEQVHALIQNPHGIYNAILRNAGQNLKCELGLVDFWSNIGGVRITCANAEDENFISSPLISRLLGHLQPRRPHGVHSKERPPITSYDMETQNSVTPLIYQISNRHFLRPLKCLGQPLQDYSDYHITSKLVEGMVQEHEGAPCNVALPKTHSVEGPGGTTAYTSIKINGVKYQRGDVVLVMPGEDEQTKRQLQALDASAMSKNELANAFWFAEIVYFWKKKKQVSFHAHWLLHSSKSFLQETSDPQEVFLLNECSDCSVESIVSHVQVDFPDHGEQPAAVQDPTAFFCRFLYQSEKGAFLDVAPHRSLSLAIEAADCYPCLLKAEQQLLSTPRLLDGPVILLEGGTYHLQELVYIKPDSPGPYILAQIQSVAQRKDKIRIQVSLLQRSAPDSRKFHDDRKLCMSTLSIQCSADRLSGKFYAISQPQNSKQLDSWLELPNHFWLESLGLDQTTCNQCLQDEMDILNKKIKPMKQHPLKALDIFSGCGGFHLGMDQSKVIHTRWSIESNPHAARTLRENMPRDHIVIQEDVNKVLSQVIQHSLGESHNTSIPGLDEVDIIYGGPPCQSFSLANAVKKDDDPRHSLALTALSFVDLYRPSYVILENVRGMVDYPLVNLDGEIMEMGIPKLWLRCLTAMDYQVHLSVLESGAYGTPQCRARLIIIASKRGSLLPTFPIPTHCFPRQPHPIHTPDGASVVSPSSLFAPLPPITVDMAISDLPQFNWYESGPSEPFSPVFTPEHGWGCQVPYKTHVQTRYQYSLRNPVGRVQQHFTKIYSAIISNRVRHIPLRPGASWKDLPANLQEKVWRIKALNKTAYKRVIGEDFFPTSVCKVDPTSRFGQVLHPTQRRVISLREYARAQGFPDTFIFWTAGSEDTIQELFKQIGNAVPIPLGIALGQAIMFALVSN